MRKGADGEQQIKAMMEKFRNDPPKTLAGEKIARLLDYKISVEKNLINGKTSPIHLPKSDVLQFYTENGNKISVRPSGTEPKIKFYVSAKSKLKAPSDFSSAEKLLDEKIKEIGKEIAG